MTRQPTLRVPASELAPRLGHDHLLPRGPHHLTREQVADSQRARLIAAFTALMAAQGYAWVRIGDLATCAGVSRATFYEHFADKQACLFAAYEHFSAEVLRALTPAFDTEAPWSAYVDATLSGYLAMLQGDLTAARAFLIEMDAAGPAARDCRRRASDAFAAVLAQRHASIRARDPSLGPLPPRAYLAVALAVREIVRDALEREPTPDLEGLAPDITMFVTAMVEGAPGARPESDSEYTATLPESQPAD